MNKDQTIGGKSLKLKDLIDLKLNVPKFETVGSDIIANNTDKNGKLGSEFLNKISKDLHSSLECDSYAVRSSAIIEDSDLESYAGQFKTVIDVKPEKLGEAIQSVVSQAYDFLNRDIKEFSILVQEYIEPDISGITFTRNPTGERDMVIEHHSGRGEEIVGGKVKPISSSIYWDDQNPTSSLPKIQSAVKNFKKIENFFGHPQDIEWCIKGGTWYFLQTRPITTISKKDYEQIQFLEKTLPTNKIFLYEKTEISEIAPRPTQITLDLLEKIYAKNGPINSVYEKHKITYDSKKILKIIGNELFVDREEELKSLLPSYSYLNSPNLKPKLSGLSGIIKSFKNGFQINRISLENYEEIFNNLENCLREDKKKKPIVTSIEGFLKVFEKRYQTVFEINLLAGISIKNLKNLLKNEDIDIPTLLTYGDQIKKIPFELKINTNDLIGNTLEVADETKFIANKLNPDEKSEKLAKWWNNLSTIKKEVYGKILAQALIYNRLREMSRWLVVATISELRKILFNIAKDNDFKDKKNIYFAKIDELLENKVSESTCIKRKEEHSKFSKFNLPTTLTNITKTEDAQKTVGISPGIAEGTLVMENEIKEGKTKKQILYTKILSPELVKHFDSISGLASDQGGLLSHLAIIARERKIPVIVNFKPGQEGIVLGDKVKIDGSTGEIEKKI